MKNLLSLVFLFFAFGLLAQEGEPSYDMYQTILLTPKPGHGQQLRAAIKAHNMKYHREGAETVNVWAINSGPRMGTMAWIKGPLTWTHMDTPNPAEGHMDDWRDNIMTHADIEAMEYWRLMRDRAYMPEGLVPKLMVVRYFEIKNQKWNNARHVFGSLVNLYREKNWDMGLQIFTNQANADGKRDWAIAWYHDSWASMDRDRNLWDTYQEMYGMDRDEFFENWNEATNYHGMEIMVLQNELSAGTGFSSGN